MTAPCVEPCFAVVVTYNRVSLLKHCLAALVAQTHLPDRIVVVDNASTDGTREMLSREGWMDRSDFELVAMPENTGGAGGFAKGLKHSFDTGAAWVWMMDDDAVPHPAALAELLAVSTNPEHAYGSLAVNCGVPAWTTTILTPQRQIAAAAADVPSSATVESLPFLGFMIHRDLVLRVGLPDATYFIAADDVEYCLRLQAAGARLVIAGRSQIEHPRADDYTLRVFGKTISCLRLPPWKRYYDTRNRILNARAYHGWKLIAGTLPGILVRLATTLVREPDKLLQLRAAFAGIVDGALDRRGRRHASWGIGQ